MNPQYKVDLVAEFSFEREEGVARGTQYQCTLCKKRLRPIKGVYEELEGGEKAKHRKKLNTMHSRHKTSCNPSQQSEEDRAEGQGGDNPVAVPAVADKGSDMVGAGDGGLARVPRADAS